MPTLAHELHQLVAVMDRAADALLARSGVEVSYARFLVLLHIREGEGLTQRELSSRLGTSEPAVSRMVAGLSRDGYIEVGRATGNRRSLSLTPRGGAALADAGGALGDGFDRIVRSAGVNPLALAASVRLITTTLQEI